jgi:hypothetical protein
MTSAVISCNNYIYFNNLDQPQPNIGGTRQERRMAAAKCANIVGNVWNRDRDREMCGHRRKNLTDEDKIEVATAIFVRCEIANVCEGLTRYWRRADRPVLRGT